MHDNWMAALAAPERVQALASYDLHHPELRSRLDRFAKGTAILLDMPTAMVTIVLHTAQFFIGAYGLEGWMAAAQGTPVEWSFCAKAVLAEGPIYVVEKADSHPVHQHSPLVFGEGMRTYAGAAVHSHDGQRLGMHCVTSPEAVQVSEEQLAILRDRADQVGLILSDYHIGATTHRRRTPKLYRGALAHAGQRCPEATWR